MVTDDDPKSRARFGSGRTRSRISSWEVEDGHGDDRERDAHLRVEDLAVSRRYYIETLGFGLEWDAGTMISVSRDGKAIMLCERAQGHRGTWLWIGVEDADVLFAEFSARSARIRNAPQNFAWAYEFSVEDPDGHVLRFGSEPKS